MVGVVLHFVAVSGFVVVTEPNVFHGLDGIKREIGIALAAAVYAIAGPDRWSWPRPKRLPCAEAVELLLDYVDDTLFAEQRIALEAHFADCGDCGDLVREYRELITLGRELGRRAEDVPADLADCATSFLSQRPVT